MSPKPAASQSPTATADTFDLVKGKFAIASLDEPGQALTVTAQFNPKDLTVDLPVGWGDPGDAGGSSGAKGGVEKQFTGAKGRSFTVELLFDDVDSDRKGQIAENLKKLAKLSTIRKPKSPNEAERRPHWCVATWGPMLKDRDESTGISCVIENLQTKYELFTPDGVPLRARVMLKLTEATAVSIKDKNKPKKPATPAGGGTAPAGGGAGTTGGGA